VFAVVLHGMGSQVERPRIVSVAGSIAIA
jgi:hypothetical protein